MGQVLRFPSSAADRRDERATAESPPDVVPSAIPPWWMWLEWSVVLGLTVAVAAAEVVLGWVRIGSGRA